ncbi:MAG: aminodeoxychorismate/anthranilate synthase component II, partial [Euryarchaeota archaeon]|nr:aminodeoxychorismate/anthranilate synthase component II [Euryarchaeota archaeon]
MKVLIIDNYDSFVYNIVQHVGELGGMPLIYRNDELTLGEAKALAPDRIILSPGPGNPTEAHFFGVCSAILNGLSPTTPTLGVCLGHQGIVAAFGGRISAAQHVMHGKTSLIRHCGSGLFDGIENPFIATRYHSLVADRASLPSCLEITAESCDDGEIMGVRHDTYPIEG